MHMHTKKTKILLHNMTHKLYIAHTHKKLNNPPILLMNFFREAGGGIFQIGSSLLAGKV